MKTRKKWLRKTTAICTAALLGTAAIPSTAFAADSYASIEKDAWAKRSQKWHLLTLHLQKKASL